MRPRNGYSSTVSYWLLINTPIYSVNFITSQLDFNNKAMNIPCMKDNSNKTKVKNRKGSKQGGKYLAIFQFVLGSCRKTYL